MTLTPTPLTDALHKTLKGDWCACYGEMHAHAIRLELEATKQSDISTRLLHERDRACIDRDYIRGDRNELQQQVNDLKAELVANKTREDSAESAVLIARTLAAALRDIIEVSPESDCLDEKSGMYSFHKSSLLATEARHALDSFDQFIKK